MSATQLTDGSPVPDDGSHRELRADGQQKGYVVLTEEERRVARIAALRKELAELEGMNPQDPAQR